MKPKREHASYCVSFCLITHGDHTFHKLSDGKKIGKIVDRKNSNLQEKRSLAHTSQTTSPSSPQILTKSRALQKRLISRTATTLKIIHNGHSGLGSSTLFGLQ